MSEKINFFTNKNNLTFKDKFFYFMNFIFRPNIMPATIPPFMNKESAMAISLRFANITPSGIPTIGNIGRISFREGF